MPMVNPKRSFEFFSDNKNKLVDISRPIIVSCESFTELKNSKCVSDDGSIWDIDLMYFDMLSRNNNLYPMDDTKRSFQESTFVQENLRNRTWYGELEHPAAESSLSRFMFIEPTRYAWNIFEMHDAGDHFTGKVGLCAPLGTSIVLPNTRKFGSNYAASCRISTPNYITRNENGQKIYVKKYKMYPITFDLVTTPGI